MSEAHYVRLSIAQLQDLLIIHLISGVDEDGPAIAPDGAVPTAITGYTEWISEQDGILTIGWDWQMLLENENIQLRRISVPSSNIMLQTAARLDLGPAKTTLLLEAFIDDFNWQTETLDFINVRYNS